ncbi:hypothetical protein LQW54_012592 [Pestalotiopsis sp. IQ-011]
MGVEMSNDAEITIWVSIEEIRQVLDIPKGTGQDDEWLAFRHILRDCVDRVMPYDGFDMRTNTTEKVKILGWEFDETSQAWAKAVAQSGSAEDSGQKRAKKNERLAEVESERPLKESPSIDPTQIAAELGQVRAATQELAVALHKMASSLEKLTSVFLQSCEEKETEGISSGLTGLSLDEDE